MTEIARVLRRALVLVNPQNVGAEHRERRGRCIGCGRLVVNHFDSQNKRISCGKVISREARA